MGTEPERDVKEERHEEFSDSHSTLMKLLSRAKRKKNREPEQQAGQTGEEFSAPGPGNAPQAKAPESPAPPPSPLPRAMMGKNNALNMLAQKCAGFEPDPAEDVPFRDFMASGEEPDPEERRALSGFQRMAQQVLQAIQQSERTAQQVPDKEQEPVPGKFLLQVSGNHMRAWGMIMPPLFGGAPVTAEQVYKELENQKIVFGIRRDVIGEMISGCQYFHMFLLAEGKAAVNGIDGRIEDHFQRDVKIKLQEKDNLTVDYKNLNWLQKINEGDTICDIIPPTEAVNGTNLFGVSVPGRSGKKAIPPKGKNTVVTGDETKLIAEVGGQVEFKRGQFHVEQLTTISGDVDNSTGNIDVIGNVVINGDIREGFVVKATGDIAVKGKVEGAILMAGGNVQIGMGMNGSLSGTLEAKGDVRTKYLENCTVHAGGCIYSDSVVNSSVSSDRDINITFGLGAIIGGTIMAANSIEAKLIGNKSNRTTVLILGGTPGVIKEKSDTDAQLHQIQLTIEELTKNLTYLARSGELTPEYKRLQGDFKLKLSMARMQKAKLQQRQAEIQASLDPTNCRLTCKTIYPITQITIGNATRILREPAYNCAVFYSDGEVRVGSK